jgi:hypothetical protein
MAGAIPAAVAASKAAVPGADCCKHLLKLTCSQLQLFYQEILFSKQ